MPAKFHPVTPAVWDRAMRGLTTDAQVVRLYLLTCPSRVSEGLFHIALGILSHDTGLSVDETSLALDELHAAGLVTYDADAEVVLDRTALRYSPLRNGEGKDGALKQDRRIPGAVRLFENVPETPLKAEQYRLAVQYAPDLALALGDRFPWLTLEAERATPGLGGSPLEAPSRNGEAPSRVGEAPSRVGEAPSRVGEAPSRAEPSRGDVRDGSTGQEVQGISCGFCGDPALLTSSGIPHELKGVPFCGWCQVVPV